MSVAPGDKVLIPQVCFFVPSFLFLFSLLSPLYCGRISWLILLIYFLDIVRWQLPEGR